MIEFQKVFFNYLSQDKKALGLENKGTSTFKNPFEIDLKYGSSKKH